MDNFYTQFSLIHFGVNKNLWIMWITAFFVGFMLGCNVDKLWKSEVLVICAWKEREKSVE